jgi:WhiB family redox-sensing transcriptional regulator
VTQLWDPRDVEWTAQAACRGLTHLFAGPPGERPGPRGRRETRALAVCASCPVVEPCRRHADTHVVEGVWGGETPTQRAQRRRSERNGPKPANDQLSPRG